MYKNVTADEYKRYFNLENEYKIDGFIVYGAWDIEKYTQEMLQGVLGQGIEFSAQKLSSFLSDITEVTIGGKKYWFSVCYGSAKLSEYAHLACLFGARWMLHIGSTGALSKDIHALDIIIPTLSVSDDSVAKLYRSGYENSDLKNHLYSYFAKQNASVHRGVCLSIQAMMGETLDDIIQWDKEGYSCVDLESSTLMHVANYFKVPSASILYVSENLAHEETVLTASYEEQKHARSQIKRTIFNAVSEIIKNPPAW